MLFFEPKCNVAISDEIAVGDYEKVKTGLFEFAKDLAARKILRAEPKSETTISWVTNDNDHFALCLASRGGDLREALKISKLFDRTGWITVIEAGEPCLSACALLFLRAARPRFSSDEHVGQGGRYAHYSATLGFHAPYLDVPKRGDVAAQPEDYAKAYANVLRTARAVTFGEREASDVHNDGKKPTLNDWFAYATLDPSIPADVLLAFMTVLPEDAYLLETTDQASRWGIEVYGVPPPAKLSERMLTETCLNVSKNRCSNARNGSIDFGQRYTMCNRNDEILEQGPDPAAGYQPSLAALYETSKITVWPKQNQPSDITIQVFSMKRLKLESDNPLGPDGVYCEIMGHWHRDRLVNLDIYTFNGESRLRDEDALKNWSARKGHAAADLTGEISYGSIQFKSSHLQPWQMLPIGTKLKSLGSNPWGQQEEGQNFFDKPPNFTAH